MSVIEAVKIDHTIEKVVKEAQNVVFHMRLEVLVERRAKSITAWACVHIHLEEYFRDLDTERPGEIQPSDIHVGIEAPERKVPLNVLRVAQERGIEDVQDLAFRGV
jgi:3-keto-L-gulonate-6-phosphate decarboxylase